MLIHAMDLVNLDEPDDNYWYAFGRIAEQYGERDIGLADYTRAKKAEKRIRNGGFDLSVDAKPAASFAQRKAPVAKVYCSR